MQPSAFSATCVQNRFSLSLTIMPQTNHLVTTGEEGFYGCCGNRANPGVPTSDWAGSEGQDFLADHASSDIDFAVMHAWWVWRLLLLVLHEAGCPGPADGQDGVCRMWITLLYILFLFPLPCCR